MTNSYYELKEKQRHELEAFPLEFAFSNKQFEEGMRKLGLEPGDTAKIYGLAGTGGFYRKTDAPAFQEMFDRHERELQAAIDSDETGEGFIFEMLNYELANHEYIITWDLGDTLRALGLTMEQAKGCPRLRHGLELAVAAQFEHAEA